MLQAMLSVRSCLRLSLSGVLFHERIWTMQHSLLDAEEKMLQRSVYLSEMNACSMAASRTVPEASHPVCQQYTRAYESKLLQASLARLGAGSAWAAGMLLGKTLRVCDPSTLRVAFWTAWPPEQRYLSTAVGHQRTKGFNAHS